MKRSVIKSLRTIRTQISMILLRMKADVKPQRMVVYEIRKMLDSRRSLNICKKKVGIVCSI